ncbi:MAG: hypothetical protein UZ08_BCD001001398 [Candidatus Parvibacillus calidus]|jgi:hypothetical protein|nr:MAG: hypothetical protein UZ08_BCD001001398 [Candidatus Parvibacillus calidus]
MVPPGEKAHIIDPWAYRTCYQNLSTVTDMNFPDNASEHCRYQGVESRSYSGSIMPFRQDRPCLGNSATANSLYDSVQSDDEYRIGTWQAYCCFCALDVQYSTNSHR